MELRNRCGKRVGHSLCKSWNFKFSVVKLTLSPGQLLQVILCWEILLRTDFSLVRLPLSHRWKTFMCASDPTFHHFYRHWLIELPQQACLRRWAWQKCVGVAGEGSTLPPCSASPLCLSWCHTRDVKTTENNNNSTTQDRCWALLRLMSQTLLGEPGPPFGSELSG